MTLLRSGTEIEINTIVQHNDANIRLTRAN